MHFQKSVSSLGRKMKKFTKREPTVIVRGRSLLPPAGHTGDLHQRLALIFKSDQGYLFSAFQWVKPSRQGFFTGGDSPLPLHLGPLGGVWRHFWLSFLGTGACYWPPVGGDRGRYSTFTGHGMPSKQERSLVPLAHGILQAIILEWVAIS